MKHIVFDGTVEAAVHSFRWGEMAGRVRDGILVKICLGMGHGLFIDDNIRSRGCVYHLRRAGDVALCQEEQWLGKHDWAMGLYKGTLELQGY